MNYPRNPQNHFQALNFAWLHVRILTVFLTLSLSTTTSSAREFTTDHRIESKSFSKVFCRAIYETGTSNPSRILNDISLEISCPGIVESSGEEQQMVTDDFERWKDGFTHKALCEEEIQYFVSYNGGTEFNEDPKNLPVPDLCSGDQIDVRMVVKSECGNAECNSTFTVVVRPQSFNIALPGIDYTCFNRDFPPQKNELWIISKQALLSFGVLSPCINVDEVEITSESTGPFITGHEYSFKTNYLLTAPNATEIVTMVTDWYWNPNGPVISGAPGDTTIQCEDLIPHPPMVTAFDLEDGPLEVTLMSKTISTYCGKILERQWTTRDDCGYPDTAVQIIRIVDETAPTLIVPEDLILECGDPIPPPSYEASDNCKLNSVTYSEEKTIHNPCEYTLTRSWVATDKCNNRTTAQQIIEVLDTKPPEIVLVNPILTDIEIGEEVQIYDCSSNPTVNIDDVRISDCCDFQIQTEDQLISSGVCDIFGYFRKWRCSYTAVDPSGNVAEFYFYMVQYDTVAPKIYNVPSNLDLPCNEILQPTPNTVYASDECGLTPNLQLEERTILDPNDPSKFAIIRTWTAEDNCHNTEEATQIIAVCGFDTTLMASAIENTVWSDQNENGIQDKEEEGINNVRVNLYTYDTLSKQRKYLVESALTRKVERQDGRFVFKHLMPDFYILELEVPIDFKLTRTDIWDNDQVDSDYDAATHMTPIIDLTASSQLRKYGAGLVPDHTSETPSIYQNFDKKRNQETDFKLDVNVFPNPSKDMLNLAFTLLKSDDVIVQIYDRVGRLITEETVSATPGFNQYEISIEDLPGGTYLLKVQTGYDAAQKMIIKVD